MVEKPASKKRSIATSLGDLTRSRYVIRHMVESDLPYLEWEGEYTHFRKLYADAFRRAANGQSVNWVVDHRFNGLIGQAFVLLTSSRKELADGFSKAYIYSFRVRPQYRSQGIGSSILYEIEQDLLQRAYYYATLIVAKDNPRARKFYQDHGFVVVDHEPGIWSFQDHNGVWRQVEEPGWRMNKKIIK